MALLIRRTDQENHSDSWHSPIALQMSLFISTISTNYRRVPLDSLLYDLLRMRQPTVIKACLASRDKNQNINTYPLDTIR